MAQTRRTGKTTSLEFRKQKVATNNKNNKINIPLYPVSMDISRTISAFLFPVSSVESRKTKTHANGNDDWAHLNFIAALDDLFFIVKGLCQSGVELLNRSRKVEGLNPASSGHMSMNSRLLSDLHIGVCLWVNLDPA